MSWGQTLGGVDSAPAALRPLLQAAAGALGWRWSESAARIPPLEGGEAHMPVHAARNARAVGLGNAAIFEATRAAAKGGAFVLTVGGDHSVAAGSISGILAARPETRVVWVDAHADINTPSVSPSGSLHGMPVAVLLRLVEESVLGDGWEWLAGAPRLDPSRLVYIGLRDIDEGEKRLIKRLGVRAYTMSDVDRKGIGAVMDETIAHLVANGGADAPIHLSFDIDGVDPTVAPATGTAVAGGLSWREAHCVCEALAETGRLGSMDLVEVNPLVDSAAVGGRESAAMGPEGRATVAAAVAFTASALGKSILLR
jgi:arginase